MIVVFDHSTLVSRNWRSWE